MTNYDDLIKKWANHYLPNMDWRLYKAQLICESNLNPYVKSSVGARGLAQFMPKTWNAIRKELGLKGSILGTDAIQAGAYYMSKLMKEWDSPRPEEDRIKLAQASYNAGLGNLLKAQKASGGKLLYKDIIASLPKVTGARHAKQTTDYVNKIWNTWKTL